MKTDIEYFKIKPLKNGRFVKPKLVNYSQDGIQKSWELVEVNDSVAVLIYNSDKERFIFVKQFRPALYNKNRESGGISLELCAGIVDKNLTLKEIASEEIYEECGYRVEPEEIEKITSFYTSIGFASSKQTLFYTEVNSTQKVNSGGGVEGEKIEVVEIDKKDIFKSSL